MNRRGFFQTLLAGAVAIFLPKSKKAESPPLVIDDDRTYTFGQDSDFTFTFNTDSNNSDVTVVAYTENFDGTYRRLTEEELRKQIVVYAQGAKESREAWERHWRVDSKTPKRGLLQPKGEPKWLNSEKIRKA